MNGAMSAFLSAWRMTTRLYGRPLRTAVRTYCDELAEFCSQYVTKGRQLYIEGRIRTRSYEKDGQKKYFTEVHADTIELLGRRDESGGGTPGAVAGFPDDNDDVPF